MLTFFKFLIGLIQSNLLSFLGKGFIDKLMIQGMTFMVMSITTMLLIIKVIVIAIMIFTMRINKFKKFYKTKNNHSQGVSESMLD